MSLSSERESEPEPALVLTVMKQAGTSQLTPHTVSRLSLGPEQRSSLEQHRGREHQPRGARHGRKQARARRGAKLEKMLQLQRSASRFAIDVQLSRAL